MAFTYQYSQPEEYHFSLDSIQMAERVASYLQDRHDLAQLQVLDLCAGCGVVGFELSWHLPQIRNFDFLEIQAVYQSHFTENLSRVNRPEVQWNFFLLNYENLCQQQWKDRYDVIVCNPPYFRAGQGKMSPSEFKNRCRFYLDSSFEKLIQSVLHCLKPQGQAFVLLRPLQEHAWNLSHELDEILGLHARAEKIADIRGTNLMRITLA